MEKLTGEQIIELFEKHDVSLSDIVYEDYPEELGEILGDNVQLLKEREGSDKDMIVNVRYFPKHGVYLSVTGYYSSDNGAEYDEISVVYPYIKAVLDFSDEKYDLSDNTDLIQEAEKLKTKAGWYTS